MAPQKAEVTKSAVSDLYQFKPFAFNPVTTQNIRSFCTVDQTVLFQGIVATSQHVYVIYYQDTHYCIARLCKTTRSWTRLPTTVPYVTRLNLCALHWDHQTMLHFCCNGIHAYHLPSNTWTAIDLAPTADYPEDMVVNVEPNALVAFSCLAFDAANDYIYVQYRIETFTDADLLKEYPIYRLHWSTKQWTLLRLDYNRLPKAKYMAYQEGHLYLGVGKKCSTEPRKSSTVTYNQIVRINLSTLDWTKYTINPYRPNGIDHPMSPRSTMHWLQLGGTVYGVGVLDTECNGARIVKHDLWSLDLSRLTWTEHQKMTVLPGTPCGELLLTGSETPTAELWLFQGAVFVEVYSPPPTAFHVALSLPQLHTLARGAFLYRPPRALVAAKEDRASSSSTKSKRRRHRKKSRPAPLTVQRLKAFMLEEHYNSIILKLPEPWQI